MFQMRIRSICSRSEKTVEDLCSIKGIFLLISWICSKSVSILRQIKRNPGRPIGSLPWIITQSISNPVNRTAHTSIGQAVCVAPIVNISLLSERGPFDPSGTLSEPIFFLCRNWDEPNTFPNNPKITVTRYIPVTCQHSI